MALYEHVFIARQDVSAQQVETLTEEFKTVLESNGGSVAKAEYWGIKTLAYKIKKNRKGHYTLLNIDAPHAAVAEMERQMGLHDDILRFITLRVDEHEEGPSAMMQARGRDDRRGGRGGDRGGRGGDRGGRGDRGDRGGDRGDRGGDRGASTEAKKEGADA
ncbi:30S ribosomal protein S6 [Pyruvatibacter mobilis]|uniref:30S ribosomal protein S6 n=1 Tax=Pyruvatibacter mobilis TaxID=1712261 RepID=UPI003C7BDFE5